MKKWLSALLIAFLTVGILAACAPEREQEASSDSEENSSSAEGEMPEKPEKLVVWEDKDKGIALEPAIASFEEEYGIKVEFKELGMADEISEQIRLDGPAGTGPDVITLPHDQIGQSAIEGLISPIEFEQSVADTFTESSIQAESYDGKLYGLPKATETPVFIYNKELMDKAPESMDEVYDFAKDFTKDKQYGFLALMG